MSGYKVARGAQVAALVLAILTPCLSFAPQAWTGGGLAAPGRRGVGRCAGGSVCGRSLLLLRQARAGPVAGLRMQVEGGESAAEDAGAAGGAGGEGSPRQGEFDAAVEKGSVKDCVALLRAEEEALKVSNDQAYKMLSSIPLELSVENEQQQQVLTSFLYSSLRKRGLLRGFGCTPATPEYLPCETKEIDVPTLESTTGLELQALTPRGSQFTWQAAGLAVCAAEYLVSKQLGLDPMAVIPLTAAAFLADRILVSGAVLESIYRFLFPQYKQKVVQHEAGHFLIAYLLGCPIQGFFLSAWDASSAGLQGQAGTIFFDNDLSSQMGNNKVTRTSIDRYSIVVMAGIAAEAVVYDQAEGGASDEEVLVSFLVGLIPPWDEKRVLNQARWAVLQSILLMSQYRESYDRLAKAMEEGRPLGECVKAIEDALPEALPSTVTAEARARGDPNAGVVTVTSSKGVAKGGGGASGSKERVEEVERELREKRSLLASVEQEEERLRDKVSEVQKRSREMQNQGEPAGASPGGGAWGDGEAQRLTEVLLAAARKKRAADEDEKKRKKGEFGGGGGGGMETQVAAAAQTRALAEIDLEIGEKDAELAKVEEEIEQLRAPKGE